MATRARKLSETETEQVEALAAYLSVEQMADFFGVSYSTMRRIIERDAAVASRYKKGKSKAIAAVAQGLVQQARNGNTTAAIFYLKTQGGWREAREDLRVEHVDGGTTDAAQIQKDVESGKLTPEQLADRYRALIDIE